MQLWRIGDLNPNVVLSSASPSRRTAGTLYQLAYAIIQDYPVKRKLRSLASYVARAANDTGRPFLVFLTTGSRRDPQLRPVRCAKVSGGGDPEAVRVQWYRSIGVLFPVLVFEH